ncbi:MAG: sulfurtransferase TusA family protein [Proteobacteria bacterium]|nr:sulfurtransferase TusA family protein [Pseudomonadota bacterium]
MKQQFTTWWAWLLRKEVISISRELHSVELPDGEVVRVTHTVDCMDTSCPRPQMAAMNMLETMKKGNVLELITDNPTAIETVPALVMTLYCQHLATIHTDDGWCIYIRKDD